MKYIINNSMVCKQTINGDLIVIVTGEDVFSITEGIDEFLEIVSLFTKPYTEDEVYHLVNNTYYISNNNFTDIISLMIKKNLLKKYFKNTSYDLSTYHLEKYKRQLSLFNSMKHIEYNEAVEFQRKINNSKVCIIRVGGIGSHYALTLASIGVENLILIDFDIIELSNTSRQILYNENDVGNKKIDIAKEKLLKYNKNLKIITYDLKIKKKEDLNVLREHLDLDLIVLCADTPRGEIQYFVDEIAVELSIPWFLYGPAAHCYAFIGPYIVPGQTKCLSQIIPKDTLIENNKIKEINSHFVASVIEPYNAFAAQVASIETLKILTGYKKSSIYSSRMYIDTDNWKVECIEYE